MFIAVCVFLFSVGANCAPIQLDILKAIESGDLSTVKSLINNGADINVPVDYVWPIHAAAIKGNIDVLEWIISQPNIDLDVQTQPAGLTPLMISIKLKNFKAVNLLIEKRLLSKSLI